MDHLTVTIVVDPEFGDRLVDAADGGPVWVAQTPVNRAAAVQWWNAHPRPAEHQGVTTFLVERGASPESWLLDVLGTVDMHYGGHGAQERQYSAVQVWGAAVTPEVRAAFEELGYPRIEALPGGFRAAQSAPAA